MIGGKMVGSLAECYRRLLANTFPLPLCSLSSCFYGIGNIPIQIPNWCLVGLEGRCDV